MKIVILLFVGLLGMAGWKYKIDTDKLKAEVSRWKTHAQSIQPNSEPLAETPATEGTGSEVQVQKPEDYDSVKQELETLKAQFQNFKQERRTSMIDKVVPKLQLADGNAYTNAKIRQVTATVLTVMHDNGVSKVNWTDINDDNLKWQAVWTPDEAESTSNQLAVEDAAKREEQQAAYNEQLEKMRAEESVIRSNNLAELRSNQIQNMENQLKALTQRINSVHSEYITLRKQPTGAISSKNSAADRLYEELQNMRAQRTEMQKRIKAMKKE